MGKSRSNAPASKDLTLLAVKGIKNLLFSNEAGFRLNARELSRRLDMSPTPIVQALKLLHYQGILGHIPNKGYFLETHTADNIRDIFTLRIAMESAGLGTILDRISPKDWQDLEQAVAAHLDALENNWAKRVLMADMAFHTTLARISTGTAGERIMRNLFEMLYLKNRDVILYISPKQQFGCHHQQILDLLRDNRVAQAQAALTEHLTAVRDAVLQGMAPREEADLDLDW